MSCYHGPHEILGKKRLKVSGTSADTRELSVTLLSPRARRSTMSLLHIACLIALCCLLLGCTWGAPTIHYPPIITEEDRQARRNWYYSEQDRNNKEKEEDQSDSGPDYDIFY